MSVHSVKTFPCRLRQSNKSFSFLSTPPAPLPIPANYYFQGNNFQPLVKENMQSLPLLSPFYLTKTCGSIRFTAKDRFLTLWVITHLFVVLFCISLKPEDFDFVHVFLGNLNFQKHIYTVHLSILKQPIRLVEICKFLIHYGY